MDLEAAMEAKTAQNAAPSSDLAKMPQMLGSSDSASVDRCAERREAGHLPLGLLLPTLSLMALGLVVIHRADQLAADQLFCRQLGWIALALPAMLAFAWTPRSLVRDWSFAALAAGCGLLAVVYFFPPINGAHRWIRIGGVGLQPSEFCKIAWVAAIARLLASGSSPAGAPSFAPRRGDTSRAAEVLASGSSPAGPPSFAPRREDTSRAASLLLPLAFTGVPALLILREPDLGTALAFLPVLWVMLAFADVPCRRLAALTLAAAAAVPLLWIQMSLEQRSRVTALFEAAAPDDRPTADGYQLHQSKLMFAQGGTWGSLAAGEPDVEAAAYHLPAAHTDFIFSVIGERFGLAGTLLCLLLFAIVIARGIAIAAQTHDRFAQLLALGITSLLAVEVLINTGMTVGLLPITGLSLPFVSYGGSGLLAHAIALGLLCGCTNPARRRGTEATTPGSFHDEQISNKSNS
jgi:cell division protein FtsW (lipid II flippase)